MQGFSKVRGAPRPEALGLSGTLGSGDSLQVGWQCGRPLCSQPVCLSGRLSELLLQNKHICLPSRRFHLTPCSRKNKFPTAWYWHENRHMDQWNKTESPERNPYIYSKLTFNKVPIGRSSLSNKWCCNNWITTPLAHTICKN